MLPLSRTELVTAISSGLRFSYLGFGEHRVTPSNPVATACLSQWYDAPFTLEGVGYRSAEQAMMHAKARLFGDRMVGQLILAATTPAEALQLGREVRGFEADRWATERSRIVREANLAKFRQHPELLGHLLDTGDMILIDANSVDLIWGVGIGADDPKITDPSAWRGENLLGFVLMEVREVLRTAVARRR